MVMTQLITGSPNITYEAAGTVAFVESGALLVRLTNIGSFSVDLTIADYISIVGSPNYNLPVIGSVQVSSINSALPAGTNTLGSVYVRFPESLPSGTALLGSVKATPDGYYQVLGSPTAVFTIAGSVTSVDEKISNFADGSVWVGTSSTNIMQPRAQRQNFEIVAGSQASNNTSGKIWASLSSTQFAGRGIELTLNQVWGKNNWDGSVAALTDAGSILVGYNEIFR